MSRAKKPLLLLLLLLLAACAQRTPEPEAVVPTQAEAPDYVRTPNVAIPDGGSVMDSIEVSDAGFLYDLNVGLEIAHPFVNDLVVTLTHEETGTAITLLTRPFSNQNDVVVTLDDSAEKSIQDDVLYTGSTTDAQAYEVGGSYRPAEFLDLFYGEALAGTWTLKVTDARRNNVGTLKSWSLSFDGKPKAPLPTFGLSVETPNYELLPKGLEEALVVNVRRLAGFEGPIEVALEGRRGGVVGDSVTIPADETQGVLTVKAEKRARLGETTVQIMGQPGKTRGKPAPRARKSVEYTFTVTTDFERKNVERLGYLPLARMGVLVGAGNDIWGWTDPQTGKEYALMGTTSGVSFVDLSNPREPTYLGMLPTRTPADRGNTWRDIKVYKDHAFVVSEATGHGMQVFDLTRLRGVRSPQTFREDAHYAGVGNTHNLVINEETGFAYLVGSTRAGEGYRLCSGGLHMVDIGDPQNPTYAGCFSGAVPPGEAPSDAYPSDVYTHDAQCVIYRGPDADYTGQEVCFTADESTVGVADVSDKTSPVQIARETYEGYGYTHQGWLSEDERYFFVNDELDELRYKHNTRTYIWDMGDLDAPKLLGFFESSKDSIDHNNYVVGRYLYQANYTSGLRILDVKTPADVASVKEVAFYDTHPEDDLFRQGELSVQHHPEDAEEPEGFGRKGAAEFRGTWSTYPFFRSSVVVMSDIDRGLFVLEPDLP